MHSQESGPLGGGSKPDPLAFSLAFAVGVICFPVRVQPPQPPTDRQTDGSTDILPQHNPQHAYMSGGKNCEFRPISRFISEI